MDLSTSSEGSVSSPLLERNDAMPPAAMRSSKSVASQIKETLFSFLRKPKALPTTGDKESGNGGDGTTPQKYSPDVSHSRSQTQRREEAFSERIITFTIPNWMGKPLALSPPLLAQYGWQCIGLDAVKCCSCSAIFSVRLPWPDADNYRDQCLLYRQKVLTGHMKICSWPSYPCPDSFVSPFLHGGAATGEIRASFVERRKNLLQLGEKLPQLERTLLKELNLSEAQLHVISNVHPEGSEAGYGESDNGDEEYYTRLSQNETASVMAMCGWDTKCSVSSMTPSVLCKSSGRSAGLWNFYSFLEQKVPEVAFEDVSLGAGEPLLPTGSKRPPDPDQEEWTPKKAKIMSVGHQSTPSHLAIKKRFFHPLQQHHPWSSWITVLKPISADEFDDDVLNSTSADSDMKYKYVVSPSLNDKKPGWVIVRDVLLKKKYEMDENNEKEHDSTATKENQTAGDNVPDHDKMATKTPDKKEVKSPPRTAVCQVRKMIKEWSSPK